MRRNDKALTSRTAMEKILSETEFITMAMCNGEEPYLVTMNHGFDPARNCLFLHCAGEGKKLEILKKNNRVWAQAMKDLGYIQGACDHRYISVHIDGRAHIVQDESEKRYALDIMIRQLENYPEPVREKQVTPDAVRRVTILRIEIEAMTAKASKEVHASL